MLTYQLRERILMNTDERTATLPADVEVTVSLAPPAAFGAVAKPSRVILSGHEAKGSVNLFTGRTLWLPNPPLNPVSVDFSEGATRFLLEGDKLLVARRCRTLGELDSLLASVVYAFPMLLNIEILDPPLVTSMQVKIGEVSFKWALLHTGGTLAATTQTDLEREIEHSWKRIAVVNKRENVRLLAALNYFHVGCRLLAVGYTAFEFMAEAILNFAKVLDVLFISCGEVSRDEVRNGLTVLGYSQDAIERDFIPVMLLRNEFDIAHVALTVPTAEQLNTLHRYTEKTEGAFRELLRRILTKVEEEGLTLLPPPEREELDAKKAETLRRLRQALMLGPSGAT